MSLEVKGTLVRIAPLSLPSHDSSPVPILGEAIL